jgi:large subunit ribosomal protein L13
MAKTTKEDSKKTKKSGTKPAPESANGKATRAAKAGEETQAAPKGANAAKPGKKSGGTTKRHPLMERTYFAKPGAHVGWKLVDAKGQPLGRLCTAITLMLMGKDKAAFTRHEDAGDHVVVINASNVVLTGKKWEDKTYHYHTNYPGGIKSFTAKELLEKHPERLIQWAVWGMLPKAKQHMARKWYKKLRVFPGADHNHTAQKPVPANLPSLSTRERA